MFYTIYKITNKINNKIYIGKHQTKNIDDGYMGSGKHLKRSVLKYGIENFIKEILFVFDNEEEMNSKEAELVTEEFCLQEDTYNMCVGGQGGFSYLNSEEGLNLENRKKSIENWNKQAIEKHLYMINNDENYRNKNAENCKINAYKAHDTIRNVYKNWTFGGKKHSETTKEKMSKSKLGKYLKDDNSQYGSFWITDGTVNKKLKKDAIIPEGWFKGRTIIK